MVESSVTISLPESALPAAGCLPVRASLAEQLRYWNILIGGAATVMLFTATLLITGTMELLQCSRAAILAGMGVAELLYVIVGGILLFWFCPRRPARRLRPWLLCLVGVCSLALFMFTDFLSDVVLVPVPDSLRPAVFRLFIEPTFALLQPGSWLATGLIFLVIAGLAGLGEELFFRGGLQPMLATCMPEWAAVLITAAIFAALHLNPFAALPLFIIGVTLGYIYVRTRNIIYPVMLHTANNLLSIFIIQSGLQPYYPEVGWQELLSGVAGLAGLLIVLFFVHRTTTA